MSTRLTANHTIIACFIGYIVQAVVNNFAPLLFLTFQSDYGVPLGQIAMLTAINFTVQLVTDAVSPGGHQTGRLPGGGGDGPFPSGGGDPADGVFAGGDAALRGAAPGQLHLRGRRGAH